MQELQKLCMCRAGHNRMYIHAVYGRIFGGFPAKNYRLYTVYIWSWPTLLTYAVYDRLYDESPAKTPYIHRTFGHYPAKNTVHAPRVRMVLANPVHVSSVHQEAGSAFWFACLCARTNTHRHMCPSHSVYGLNSGEIIYAQTHRDVCPSQSVYGLNSGEIIYAQTHTETCVHLSLFMVEFLVRSFTHEHTQRCVSISVCLWFKFW